MSFFSSYSNVRLVPNRCDSLLLLSPQRPFRIREFRVYKRRRLKLFRPKLTLTNRFNFSFDNNFFQNLPSLEFLAPVLGLTSGVTLYLSSRLNLASGGNTNACDIGEWILFTSPTPFNRFVILRCPSISFEGSELMEGVNERLVKEDRHFVRLNSGRMIQASKERGEKATQLEYQRVCISTEDGGVVSIDWPANLDLNEEHGLDTTVLVVPGAAEGSMDEKVKAFVREALFCGLFPVVMNPRGCASSPLTTPRLFTAADSDDVSAAIQFIHEARPWNTLMGVGWGYGANMLTKYLAEVGEKTPLTAATCIDNPFDLEEATRTTPYDIALNEKLAGGLIHILQSNKELFQGRAKGFDVEKALSAKSVREFEKAISMISYGYEAIEDFYSKSSTRSLVYNVKIPVLFIQNDDGSVPLFSIPRGLIAENPYTSLLLCSCSPARSSVSWCHHLTIEWLTAVELGLLKGRHPLLKDVDVTISPSIGLAFGEGRMTGKGRKGKKHLDLSRSKATNGYSIDPARETLDDGDTAASIHLRSRQDSLKDVELGDKGFEEVRNDILPHSKSVEAELVKEETNPNGGEIGQVLQTAQVVMNMLDITMPGTLKEAEKQKVLAAVNQGESLMKALQDAVPEDVLGKLTAAVSVIMQTQGTHLKQGIEKIPKMSSGFKSKTEESVSDAHATDEIKRTDDLVDGSVNIQVGSDKTTGGQGSEFQPSENLQKSSDVGQSQPMSSHQDDIPSSNEKDTKESGKVNESDEFTKEKASAHADSSETGMQTSSKPSVNTQAEKAGTPDETLSAESKADRDGGTGQIEIKDENNPQKKEEKDLDVSTDQNKATVSCATSSEAQPVEGEGNPSEGEGNDNQKKENKDLQHASNQNKSTIPDPNPTFSVSQALNALTGIDDSTQVAVNSVFGVIENMISQLEEKDDDESRDGNQVRTENIDSVPKTEGTFEKEEDGENDHKLTETEDSKHDHSWMADGLLDSTVHHDSVNGTVLQDGSASLEESPQNPSSPEGIDSNYSQGKSTISSLGMPRSNDHMVSSNPVIDFSDRPVNNIPLYRSTNQLHGEYFCRYLLSKPTNEALDIDSTTSLLLDYFPEEGKWKLLEQPGEIGYSTDDVTTDSRESKTPAAAEVNETENVIEPSYVILDTDRQPEPVEEFDTMDMINVNAEQSGEGLEELLQLVEVTISDSLRVEVERRLSVSELKEIESQLALDIETVATAASLSVRDDEELTNFEGKDYVVENASQKCGSLNGENIIRAISSAVQSTHYLRRVLPVGVVVGSSLAALRKYFYLSTLHEDDQNDTEAAEKTKLSRKRNLEKTSMMEIDQMHNSKTGQNGTFHSPASKEGVETGLKGLNKDGIMVGAVTAALGASALLVPEQDPLEEKGTAESSSKTFKEKGSQLKEPERLEEPAADKHQVNIVTSLAEKALSVAGPVVPTKEDGELDHERLVAMLADLGQRGGMLRLVGKVALLWGGIRGAMSLTDRLIMFLHIADRPLYQRILGFVGMGLVLWSPVVVPLLPTLVLTWTSKTPPMFAQLVCIIGFYIAVMILLVLWGKRVRNYENPLEQYGLELTSSSKIQGLLMGLLGGVMLVILIQSVNALLGGVCFSWPSNLFLSSLDFTARLKVYGKLLLLAVRGIVTATGVVLVEELLFRSWLPDEIAADLGYHWGIIISGFAFSLFQRSLMAIPGLWLLSLALAGIRQRNDGSLSIPIGLRAGIMASSFFLQTGGFLIYKANLPLWVTATYPFQPFSGLVGLAFSLLLAIVLYPRQPLLQKKPSSSVQE